MAYDANDPADKKIVDDAVAEATQGLVAKRDQLLNEVKDLRKNGGGDNVVKLEKAESQLTEAQDALREANGQVKKLTTDLGKATEKLTGANARADKLVVTNEVKTALADAKIAPAYHKAVEAMFVSQAVVKTDGDTNSVMIGDKPIGEVLKTFAASDEGKAFVGAPSNSGGGSQGGGGKTDAKSITRSTFDGMDQSSRHAHFQSGGTVIEN
jgi:hypothetical protein